jgi:hypothetical protein
LIPPKKILYSVVTIVNSEILASDVYEFNLSLEY